MPDHPKCGGRRATCLLRFGQTLAFFEVASHQNRQEEPWSLPDVEENHQGIFKMGMLQNGWFIIGTSIKMNDLEVPPFMETPI